MTDSHKEAGELLALADEIQFAISTEGKATVFAGKGSLVVQALRLAATRPQAAPPVAWQDDPSSDERWNAGVDCVMKLLCDFMGVDPHMVCWDAATETVDGDISAVIGNILRAKLGEDWGPDAAPPASPSPGAEREALKSVENEIAHKIDQLDEYVANHCQGDSPEKVHARTIAEGRKLQANMDLILVSRALSREATEPAAAGDFYLVPREIIDQFPEINVNNYDHNDACALNAWGCEVVTNSNPAPDVHSVNSLPQAVKALEEIASENTGWNWTDKDTAEAALGKIAVQMREKARTALLAIRGGKK